MASWMVHLRVADCLLTQLSGISDVGFVMGNVASDSGIPNEDWSAFIPSSEVSHFRTTDEYGLKKIHKDLYDENSGEWWRQIKRDWHNLDIIRNFSCGNVCFKKITT